MAIPPDDALWNAVASLAQLLLHEESVSTTLDRVASLAATLIPGADEVGLTVAHDGRPNTDAATGGIVYEVDSFQYEADEGPCLHALLSGQLVEISSMRAEQRWPAYAAFAARLGVESSLSCPLTIAAPPSLGAPVIDTPPLAAAVKEGRVGVLNLYSRREGDFRDAERWAALTFAQQAAIAIYNARTYESVHRLTQDLQAALTSRSIIEQAKGILMGRLGCNGDEAFHELRRQSQLRHRKLRDLAADLIADPRPDPDPP